MSRGRVSVGAFGGALLLAASALLVLPGTDSAATPTALTTLVSRATGASGTAANGHEPSLNGDGRFVTFESSANLDGLNPANATELWLRDRTLGTTQLVSRLTGASGAAADDGPVSNSFGTGSGGASTSADGRYVVYDSDATNLAGSDRTTRCDGAAAAADPATDPTSPPAPPNNTYPGGNSDVFLRDMVAGTTKLISHSVSSTTTPGNDFSTDPRISADGSTITFASSATNLTSEAQSNASCQLQVVAYKVASDTATIVSSASTVALVLGAEGNKASDSNGAMSSDGHLVAFSSFATNLTADTVTQEEVFVRNLTTGLTTLVSRATGVAGAPADNGCSHPTITLDGTKVAMGCEATNFGVAGNLEEVYIRDLGANTTTLVSRETPGGTPSTAASSPVMSGDGSTVIYESDDSTVNGNSVTQVVATDVATGVNTVESRASGATGALGNLASTDIAVNSDGSVAAFESDASNLTTDTPPRITAAFVRGAVPVLPSPSPTPTPTAVIPPVPPTGAASDAPGWPGLAPAAAVLGAVLLIAAAVARRRTPGAPAP